MLLTENVSLRSQLSSLQGAELQSMKLQKQLLEEQQFHEVTLQKYKKSKDNKQKVEAKLKETKHRYQNLASELANSLQLMKKYQIQCTSFEKEIETLGGERGVFRKEIESLKAQLEVMKAERASSTPCDADDSRIVEYSKEIQMLTEENFSLRQRLHQENEEAIKKIEFKTQELQDAQKKLDDVNERLFTAEESLGIQQHENSALLQEASLKVEKIKEERMKEREEAIALQKLLEEKMKESAFETHTLSSNLTKANDNLKELELKLNRVEREHSHTLSLLNDSESSLSYLLTEIERYKSENSTLVAAIAAQKVNIDNDLKQKESEITKYKEEIKALQDVTRQEEHLSSGQLYDEVEGYTATIKRLKQRLDEAETREIEHEIMKQKIRMFEKCLGDSSLDRKALIQVLHETMQEIPSLSTQAEQFLQDRNLQLEEQISVLSQWNDKQRQEIEQMERTLEESSKAYDDLIAEIKTKENLLDENLQLKLELKEVETEINALRRQVRADVQEEFQIKLQTQTQIVAVFNQHNTQLQRQVRSS